MAIRTLPAIAALTAIALGSAACTANPTAEAAAEAVTLTIGTDDSPGVPAADQITALAAEAAKSGDVVLEPVWHAAGDTADWDQAIARMVVDSELDLAVVPSRAWASLGVTSLDPLTTPFLIQSDEALDAVLSDDAVMTPMLQGLDELGLVGIAAMPEGLRRPFGYHGPLVDPKDYAGGTVRSATAEVNRALYEALGAGAVTDEHPDFEKHLGTDSSYLLDPYGTATGNVVFYPKVNVLVANADAWASLDERARQAITEAAGATREWVRENQPTDADAANAWCAGGGSIVAATADQVASFRAAAQPVVDAIAANGGNADIIAAISEVVAGVSAPDPVTGCETTTAGPGSDTSIAGTYRWEVTAEVLEAAGVSADQWCPEVCGIYTQTLVADGTWTHRWEDPDGKGESVSAHGTWSFDGENLIKEESGYQALSMVVRPDAAGNLTVTPFGDFPEIDVLAITATPWIKVQ
ncbi:hypothetical protein [Microbacterium sp. BK668]|uniref:TRAP transporter substrate-binding protein n=1 Tax=Microbacterium sp. BK668 TaxID=2512118 RepID=UPI00105DEC69|nr:hypothetical protein [Microbacterium sp. BK668]TDN90744.1 TRAP-type C4-dicarboxylate transport system substrate-binding protein [Microbacterium sp. BK668]